jgi:hypothetical protein
MTRETAANPTNEIEITSAMIDAGCKELALCESYDPPWSTVEAIYRGMQSERRGSLLLSD